MASTTMDSTMMLCTLCDARVMGVLPCKCCDFTELAYWAFGMSTWKGNKAYCRDCLASSGWAPHAARKAAHFHKKKFQCCATSMASLTFIAKDGTSHILPPPPPPEPPTLAAIPSPDLAANTSVISSEVTEEVKTQRINILTLQAFQQALDTIKEDIHHVLGELVSLNGKIVNLEEVHAASYNLQQSQIESVLTVASRLHEVERALKIPTALSPTKNSDNDEEEGEPWVEAVGDKSVL